MFIQYSIQSSELLIALYALVPCRTSQSNLVAINARRLLAQISTTVYCQVFIQLSELVQYRVRQTFPRFYPRSRGFEPGFSEPLRSTNYYYYWLLGNNVEAGAIASIFRCRRMRHRFTKTNSIATFCWVKEKLVMLRHIDSAMQW